MTVALSEERVRKALSEGGFLSPEQLVEAEHHAHRKGIPLGDFLVDSGYLSEEQYLSVISELSHVPFRDELPSGASARDLPHPLPIQFARKHTVFPFRDPLKRPALFLRPR